MKRMITSLIQIDSYRPTDKCLKSIHMYEYASSGHAVSCGANSESDGPTKRPLFLSSESKFKVDPSYKSCYSTPKPVKSKSSKWA